MKASHLIFCLLFLLASDRLHASSPTWFYFGVSDYAVGQELSETGAKRGSWGATPVPTGSSAVVTQQDARKCLEIDALDRMTFTASQGSAGSVYSTHADATVSFASSEANAATDWQPPTLDSAVRAALVLGRDASGNPAFFGYSTDGWQQLASGSVVAKFDTWYEIRTCFYPKDDGMEVVYFVKSGEDYAKLATAGGVSRFTCAGSGTTWQNVGFQGSGSVEKFGTNNGACRVSYE